MGDLPTPGGGARKGGPGPGAAPGLESRGSNCYTASMEGTRDGLGAADEGWWTLGEAAERANVSHMALQVWINSGDLPCDLAWREGSSVRVVRPLDLAALVPGLALDPAEGGASLGDRALHMGELHSRLGGEPRRDPTLPLAIAEGERSHEAELRREVERLRNEVHELRSARMVAEIRGERRSSPRASSSGGSAPAPARPSSTSSPASRIPALRAAGLGLTVGLVAAAGWAQRGGGVVEAAPPIEGAVEPGTTATAPVARTDDAQPPTGAPAPAPVLPFEPSPGEVSLLGSRPPAEEALDPPAGPVSSPFPVTLREIDPTAYVDAELEGDACAFHALWDDGGGRYRASLGPCIGSHNADGLVRGTHRVDGAACCAHHAFVERMTSATRDEEALGQLVAEAEASRAEGVVPPLLRLRAERSAQRFLGHALLARHGRPDWAAAGLDGDGGDHAWVLDPSGDPMRLSLHSWVVPREGDEPLRFELDLRMGDGPEGDRGLAFRWLER